MSVTEKHALVIGGTRGIGRAVVNALAADGYHVSAVGRHIPTFEDMEKIEPGLNYWQGDVCDFENFRGVLDKIFAQNGPIQSLVFMQRYRGQGDSWSGEITTGLTATRNILDYTQDYFDDSTDHSVVMVASVASRFIASEQQSGYHVAKAGLEQLARYYAVKLGPRSVRVNNVAPCAVIKDESRAFYMANNELRELYENITPLRRMGTAEEVANAVCFLCGSKASFITGQTLVVDGGISLQWHESLARQLTPLKDVDVIRS